MKRKKKDCFKCGNMAVLLDGKKAYCVRCYKRRKNEKSAVSNKD